MDIKLNYSEGAEHDALLHRVDFRPIVSTPGPLSVDMGVVPFFEPTSLTMLFGAFRLHSKLYPGQERRCAPSFFKSADIDVNRYVQRVNFFDCCSEFEKLKDGAFSRHDPAGRFVPITVVQSMQDTDRMAQQIVKVIFTQSGLKGEAELKYALTELMDNSLQHAASPVGCVIQTQLYPSNFIEGVILDCGIGIRRHLSENREIAGEVTTDERAIEKALEPFVSGTHNNRPTSAERTRFDGLHNAGLGLSVCSKLMSQSGGFLQVVSGDASVKITAAGVEKSRIAGWPGTLVVFKIHNQKLARISDIIKAFDLLKAKGHNLNEGPQDPLFI